MYKRTHGSSERARYLLFSGAFLTRKCEVFIFELVGRKEESIVHVTYYFQLADLPRDITTAAVLR